MVDHRGDQPVGVDLGDVGSAGGDEDGLVLDVGERGRQAASCACATADAPLRRRVPRAPIPIRSEVEVDAGDRLARRLCDLCHVGLELSVVEPIPAMPLTKLRRLHGASARHRCPDPGFCIRVQSLAEQAFICALDTSP